MTPPVLSAAEQAALIHLISKNTGGKCTLDDVAMEEWRDAQCDMIREIAEQLTL